MSSDPIIRRVDARDRAEWMRMRLALWPETDTGTLDSELTDILADHVNQPVFVADVGGGRLAGFVEVSIHPHAIGCETRPVGYVEGWYVDPEFRRVGVGKRLIESAENWMRERGCLEAASDAHSHNDVSRNAHRALGYVETGQLVHFMKKL